MARSSRDAWVSKHKKSIVEFLFRSYLMPLGEHWPDRHRLLCGHAAKCGDNYHWTENVFVGENRDRQCWMIFGFKEFGHKVQFDAGIAEIMDKDFGPALPGGPLPNGLANPDRDFSGLARRMARKGDYGR